MHVSTFGSPQQMGPLLRHKARRGRKSLSSAEEEGKTDPVLLEAILRTEEAVLDSQLQACWTLEGAGVIVAVSAEALALGRRFFGHDRGWSGLRNLSLWELQRGGISFEGGQLV